MCLVECLGPKHNFYSERSSFIPKMYSKNRFQIRIVVQIISVWDLHRSDP